MQPQENVHTYLFDKYEISGDIKGIFFVTKKTTTILSVSKTWFAWFADFPMSIEMKDTLNEWIIDHLFLEICFNSFYLRICFQMLERAIVFSVFFCFELFCLILLEMVKKFIYSKPPGRRLVMRGKGYLMLVQVVCMRCKEQSVHE